jgi:hypothetical protein
MRWTLIGLAIVLAVLWVVFKFAVMVTSGLIHILLAAAIIFLVLGLIRGASRSSAP